MTGLGVTPEPEADDQEPDAGPPEPSELDLANARVAAAFPVTTHSNRRQKYKRPGGTPTVTASQSKRNRLLDLIEGGSSISDALADTGISQKSHEYYRRTDPQYRARVDIARRQHAKSRGDGWTGDSASFNETFFPEEYPTPPFHYDILRILKSAAPGTITLINCYPNSGKTRILENHICETLAVDPQHRFVIASKAQLHARKMLDTVKDRMTNITSYPGYIGRFGPFYVDGMDRAGKPWTRDFIKIARNDSNQRDHNVQVMGWSGQILGARVDTIILDDIQTGDNMSQVEEMLGKFRREFYTRLKGGRIIIIGNRIANGDFYERLLDLDIIEPENHFDFPAVDHQGNSLWPDRWPTDELDKTRRVVGESVWWTTYQQKPQLASNATFDEDMVERAKDHDRRVGTFTPGEPCVLSIDPGLDPGATAIVALGFGADQMRVIDAEKHYDFSQQEQILDLIEQYAIRYQPQHVVIETVAFQRALARDERLDAMSRRLGFQVRGHITNRNKLDPVMGVAAMASSFIRDEMRIPWAEDATQSRMEPLVTELRAWRPNVPTKLITQDLVMALWFAWVAVLDLRHGMGMGADGWRRSNHLPWQRSSAPRLHAVRRSA